MVDAVTSSSIIARSNASRERLADSEQTFMSLLTVQLKNQDPLSPLDSNQFTQQIVQMTGVEQQLIANDLLSMLVGMNDGGLAGAVDLIGKTVTAQGDKAQLADGEAEWLYDLDRSASSVKLEVIDSFGKTVWSGDADSKTGGRHAFNWDGKDSTGAQRPDGGTYSLKVTALGASGEGIGSTTYVEGVASSVEALDGQTVVAIGNQKVPLSSVIRVKPA